MRVRAAPGAGARPQGPVPCQATQPPAPLGTLPGHGAREASRVHLTIPEGPVCALGTETQEGSPQARALRGGTGKTTTTPTDQQAEALRHGVTDLPRTLHVTCPGLWGPWKQPDSWEQKVPACCTGTASPPPRSARQARAAGHGLDTWSPGRIRKRPLFSAQRPSLGLGFAGKALGPGRGGSRVAALQHKRRPTKTAFSSLQGRGLGPTLYGRNPPTSATAGPRG